MRACRRARASSAAIVPPEFPVAYADALRAGGVELEIDAERFALRRRVKTAAQLDGIRRAQKAADAAMAEAASLIHALPEGLSCEHVRAAMIDVCDELGCDLPPDVIVVARGAVGGRPRVRLRRDRARRAGGRRHLAARPALAGAGRT